MPNNLSGKTIVIAGGSGFLGISMTEHFMAAGASVTILSRSVPKVDGAWTHCIWDARTLGKWTAAIDGADAIVNLTGRTVNCITWFTRSHRTRWTGGLWYTRNELDS